MNLKQVLAEFANPQRWVWRGPSGGWEFHSPLLGQDDWKAPSGEKSPWELIMESLASQTIIEPQLIDSPDEEISVKRSMELADHAIELSKKVEALVHATLHWCFQESEVSDHWICEGCQASVSFEQALWDMQHDLDCRVGLALSFIPESDRDVICSSTGLFLSVVRQSSLLEESSCS